MATGAQSNVATGADEHRWKMCVSGCTVDETKHIISLPCFHSICSMRCLNNLKRHCRTVSNDDKMICSICYLEFKPEDLEHRVVPKDVFLKKPGEALAAVVTCDVCTLEHPAIAYCSECAKFLCGGCKVRHSIEKASHLHPVEEGVPKWNKIGQGKCKVHPLNNNSHYCSSCSEKVCAECVEQHNGHSIFNIEESYDNLATSMAAAKRFKEKCLTVRDEMEKKKVELKADWFTVMKNLNEAFAQTITTLRDREAQLKLEARKMFMKTTLDIQVKRQTLKQLMELATRNYNVSREIINNRDQSAAAHFLRHYKDVLNKTSTLGQSIEHNYDNFVEKDLHLTFTFKESNTTEDVINAVSTYGQIEDSYTGRKADPTGHKKTYSRAKKSATATTFSASVVQPSSENMHSAAAAAPPVSPSDEGYAVNFHAAESATDVPRKPEEVEKLGCDTTSGTTEPEESNGRERLQVPQQRTLQDNEAAGSSSRLVIAPFLLASVVQPSTENMLSLAAAPVTRSDEEDPANHAESVGHKNVPRKPEEEEEQLGCATTLDTPEPKESNDPDRLQLPQQRTLQDNEAAGSSSRKTQNLADDDNADATLDSSVSSEETADVSQGQGGLGRRELRKKVLPSCVVAASTKKTEAPLDETKRKRGRPLSLAKKEIFDSFEEAPAESIEELPKLAEYPVQGNVKMKVKIDDGSEDYCFICLDGGVLICCDECPKTFHVACHAPVLTDAEISGDWQCYHCTSLDSLRSEAAALSPDEGVENLALVPDNKRDFPLACKFVVELYKIPEVPTIRWIFPRGFLDMGIAGEKVPFHLKYIRERLTNGQPEPFCNVEGFLMAFRQMFIQAFFYYKKHRDAKHARICFQKFLKLVDEFYPQQRRLFVDVHSTTSH